MPLKHDDKRRWVEMEFLVPGNPEDVWRAVATGPGMSAWFTRTKVEERVGGDLAFDFGEGMVQSGKVTAWEPPHRFAYEEYGWAGEAPPLATEVTVTTRSGDRCVVRMVHSLYTSSDEWDDQFDGFEAGWPGFFEVLRVYLKHFAGQKAAIVWASGISGRPAAEAWTALTSSLGLMHANAGEERAAPSDAPVLGGVVERTQQTREAREVMLRIDRPMAGVALTGTHAWNGQTRASITLFLYGDDAEAVAERETPKWEAWMKKRFPAAKAA